MHWRPAFAAQERSRKSVLAVFRSTARPSKESGRGGSGGSAGVFHKGTAAFLGRPLPEARYGVGARNFKSMGAIVRYDLQNLYLTAHSQRIAREIATGRSVLWRGEPGPLLLRWLHTPSPKRQVKIRDIRRANRRAEFREAWGCDTLTTYHPRAFSEHAACGRLSSGGYATSAALLRSIRLRKFGSR